MTMQIIDQPGHTHSHLQLGVLEAMNINIYNNIINNVNKI